MKPIHTLTILPLLLLTVCCNTQQTAAQQSQQENSIALLPDKLVFEQQGGEQQFYVTSSAPGIALYSDEDWVTSIEPPYSAYTEGTFTVKVKANGTTAERNGNVVVKVGQTRAYLPISQQGLDPVETGIETPEGYTLVWHDEFNDYEGLPASADWKYQTGDGGWGNNELQDYVAGEYNGVKIAEVSNGTLKVHAKKIDGKVRSVRLAPFRQGNLACFLDDAIPVYRLAQGRRD